MHRSSMILMSELFEKYLNPQKSLEIYDIGSYGSGGSYKRYMCSTWNYTGVDIREGPNVDIVLKDPYKDWDIKAGSVDVVISGQAFEHIEYFWLTMEQIARILKPGGLFILIVPSAGRIHRHPVDCWRFYPDGLKALAKYVNFKTLESERTKLDPKWRDCHLVAQKPKE